MHKTTRLIVPSNKEIAMQGLIMSPFLFMALLFLFCILDIEVFFGSYFLGLFVNLFIKGLLCFLMGMFLFGIVYGLFFMDNKTPAAILDENGIWMKRHGLIPWDNVDQVKIYSIPTVKHIEDVGIHVKNTNVLQSNWEGKMEIFWSRIFNRYHINLTNIALNNDEVINFARQYIPKK